MDLLIEGNWWGNSSSLYWMGYYTIMGKLSELPICVIKSVLHRHISDSSGFPLM